MVLNDREVGQNPALEMARDQLRLDGAVAATVVATDLPLLIPADLADLMDCTVGGVAIAPDGAGRGTNALTLPLAVPFTFAFGFNLGGHRSSRLATCA